LALNGGGQLHTPAAVLPGGKNSRYPFDRMLGGPQSRSGRDGVEENSPCRDLNPGDPACRRDRTFENTVSDIEIEHENCSQKKWKVQIKER